MELKQNLITRVMVPGDKYPIYHDVKIQASKKLRAAVFKITDLARIANDEGEVAFDMGALHHMLEAVDAKHTYPQKPTSDKRWDDEPIWKMLPPHTCTAADPLGQGTIIEYMGKPFGALSDDGKFIPLESMR